MQAITTRYIPPTNHKGPRFKATSNAGSITIEQSEDKNEAENHELVCIALLKKLDWGWTGAWVGGGNRSGSFYWVCHHNSLEVQI